jgi:N-acetylglucosaminyldiphosphoundecaprenol N-acetyl-beta-D-mannosaminyltransferase
MISNEAPGCAQDGSARVTTNSQEGTPLKDLGKFNTLGVMVNAVDYDAAVAKIVTAARAKTGFSVTALAVHGIMVGKFDSTQRYRLNHFDLVTPDGQPVRWFLNLRYGIKLPDRVYGPNLMLRVCSAAARERIPVYFYGSSRAVIDRLTRNLKEKFPGLEIGGAEPSKFRSTNAKEKEEVVRRIRASGAGITFVGLGCPRQEVFAFEYRDALAMPVIAVGAAFDYHAGLLKEPPLFLQNAGLQWLYRLAQDPARLWKRYVILNTAFLAYAACQLAGVWRPDPLDGSPPVDELLYG